MSRLAEDKSIEPQLAQETRGPFRTNAWVQAWLDTWGTDSRIDLIDFGGNKNPLEILYRIKSRLKHVWPVDTLALAGVGLYGFETPRSEYSNLNELISRAGSYNDFLVALGSLKWHQFFISDVKENGQSHQQVCNLNSSNRWRISLVKSELAYSIGSVSFESYLASLGANTRTAYFNRRARLADAGEIELCDLDISKAHYFFELLNQFHIQRWKTPCYSKQSILFLSNFVERFKHEGGRSIFQTLAINGEIVSVLFDLEYEGVRYNLQSGYLENRFHKVALGSIHFGYAVEDAITKGLTYDFMAGSGKNSNYKERVANQVVPLNSYMITRGMLKTIYKLYGK